MNCDPHHVLGVSPEATPEQVRRAWRLWSQLICPDRFDREKEPRKWEAENAKLQAVHRAYEALAKTQGSDTQAEAS